ncbi:MAG: hypothetical protein JSR58_05075 [Verrucomicrobia bacterium]|nr:hypothetical protein [Verrucomicrobiota bacterium]
MLKRLLILVCLVVLYFPLSRWCHKQTHGFTITGITQQHRGTLSQVAYDPEVFAQPYHYLGYGAQAFVFASADGKYVIKFLKQKRHQIPLWVKLLPHTSTYERYARKKGRKKARELAGYEMALSELQKETQLVMLHYKRSTNLPHLQLTDPLNIQHEIDLNRTDFIVQRRAQMIYPTIEAMFSQGKQEDVKKVIHSLCQNIVSRCKKGIHDRDPNIGTNMGVIGTDVVQIDLGKLVPRENIDCQEELMRAIAPFQEWTMRCHPELTSMLQTELELRK